MSKIFFVLGKSCSGKDTIFRYLKDNKELNLRTVVGYTTRPMRVGETEGVEYHFVSEDRLDEMKEKGMVIECRDYNTVHGKWSYFTADDGQIDLGKGNYLYIGTLESYNDMVKYYGTDVVVPIYIEVESGERETDSKVSQNMQNFADVFWLTRKISKKKILWEQEFAKDTGIRI